MRGHVYKRGTTWTAVYDEGHDGHGRRRQRSKGGFATRRDAQRFLTDVLARMGDGSYAAPSKVTLGEFLEGEWLPAVEGTLRPLSVQTYAALIRDHIVPRLGSLRLQAVTGGHLNSLYRELEQAGLSVSTRRLTHAVLHRALKDAVRWGKLVRNPADQADPPAKAENQGGSLDGEGARTFPRPRWRGSAVPALATGGHDRHEEGRVGRPHLAVSRPRRCPPIG